MNSISFFKLFLVILVFCLMSSISCTEKKGSPKKNENPLVGKLPGGEVSPEEQNSPSALLEPKTFRSENALDFFQKAFEAVVYPKGRKGSQKRRKIRKILKGRGWNQALVDELLEKNSKALVYLDKGLECAHVEFSSKNMKDGKSKYLPWATLAKIKSLQILYFFKNNQPQKGLQSVLELLRLGYLLERGAVSWKLFLQGLSFQKTGLTFLQILPFKSNLSPSTLTNMIRTIKKYEKAFMPSVKKMLGREVKDKEKMLKKISRGKDIVISTVFGGNKISRLIQGNREERREKLADKNFFHLEKTKNLFEEDYRALKQCLAMSYKEGKKQLYSRRLKKQKISLEGRKFRRENPPSNAFGKHIYTLSSPSLTGFLEAVFKTKAYFGLARVYLALIIFKKKTGDLPDSLENLTPQYIKKIPLDPFDKKRIKYSKSKKMLYSSGSKTRQKISNNSEFTALIYFL